MLLRNGAGKNLFPFLLQNLPASDGVLLPLSPTEQQELNDHLQTGHLNKTNLCRGCLEAEGPRKIHKSVRDIDKATHTLHIDIAGPLVTSDDGYVYFLVGALRVPGFPLMIDARPLTSRTSTEVCDELEKLVAFFEALQSEGFATGETKGSREFTVIGQESSLLLTSLDFSPITRPFTTHSLQVMTLSPMELQSDRLD